MPAVIAAAHDLELFGMGPGDPDTGGGGIGSGFQKDAHLGRWHKLPDFFCQKVLVFLGQCKTKSFLMDLFVHRIIHFIFPVS